MPTPNFPNFTPGEARSVAEINAADGVPKITAQAQSCSSIKLGWHGFAV
jgi:hypothetical protein